MSWFDRLQEVIGLLMFCLVAWLARDWLGNIPSIGAILAVTVISSWLLGQRAFAFAAVERAAAGFVTYVALLCLAMTGLYYASIPLNTNTTLLLQAFLGVAIALVPPPLRIEFSAPEQRRPWLDLFLIGLGLASLVLLWRAGWNHQTFVSVRTPWPLLPDGSFLLICVPILTGIAAALLRRSFASAALAFTSWASISALPLILYPLGYGFDGFIHRASEAVLATTGALQPKPLYYLGQYVWITWMQQSLDIPLAWSDPWLLPISLGIGLFAMAGLLKRSDTRDRFLPLFLLLFLPLGAFVTTTPQALAYVLGWGALVVSLWPALQGRAWILPLALSAWAVASHPLGGLPFAMLVGGFWLTHHLERAWLRAAIKSISVVTAVCAIPLAFWAQSQMGNTPILWTWEWMNKLSWPEILPPLFFEPRQTLSVWLDGTEWIAILLPCILFGVGVWTALRPLEKSDRWLAFTGLGLLLTQFVLARAATFTFLISYERSNYTDRLAVISALILAIPAARWLSRRYSALVSRSGLVSAFVLMALVASWATHVYDSLPRHDAAQASSGWSVGQADFEAVRWIHERASNEPYTVLANQTVSAAALETYGFARYEGDVFYYPLPTGGPLYQQFLQAATAEASTSTIREAARLTKSTRVYVVINDYWWDAERVNQHLAQLADSALSFQKGRVWVYEFQLSNTANTAAHN